MQGLDVGLFVQNAVVEGAVVGGKGEVVGIACAVEL